MTNPQQIPVSRPQKLFGKTALVTGADGGFGRASALALARAGAQVLVHHAGAEIETCAVVEQIRQGGGRAQKICAELRSPDGARELAIKAREVVGCRLGLLVFTAAIPQPMAMHELAVDDFNDQVAANVRAPMFLIRHLQPILCSGSSIQWVSRKSCPSDASMMGYAATQGALEALAQVFSRTLGSKGVRVNTLSVDRAAMPDDIAAALVFLASDDARWMTGSVLRVGSGKRRRVCEL